LIEAASNVRGQRPSSLADPVDLGSSSVGPSASDKLKGETMERFIADCRRFESDSDCQLTIIGPEDDVVAAAAQHAAASHGHEDTPELREQLRSLLEPESAYIPGERAPEPFPA
jgi:hypothetical protein